MKKIISLFLIMTSPLFACDEPYEEIGGFKIGCPFDLKEDQYQEIQEEHKPILYDKAYWVKQNIKFFDEAFVTVVDKKISFVLFRKKYRADTDEVKQYVKDIRMLAQAMKNKWGNFNIDYYLLNESDNPLNDPSALEAMYLQTAGTLDPKSKVLGSVAIMTRKTQEGVYIAIDYSSKEFLAKVIKDLQKQKTNH